jgi:hypothetical protein
VPCADDAVTWTETVAAFPSESTTWTTSVTPPVAPAWYAPDAASIDPPEALVASDQSHPVPLPPEAVNAFDAPGASEAELGAIETPAVMVTAAVAAFPSESTTRTTSAAPPVAPARYAPVAASMVPPEPLLESAHAQPAPLPPEAVNACAAFGASEADPGTIETPAVTVTTAEATSPIESVTWTTSATAPVVPAVYAPVAASMWPPEASVERDQAYPAPLPPDAPKPRLPLGATDAVVGATERAGSTVTLATAP